MAEKDPRGKVIRTTDALGAQQVFEYDAWGDLKRSFDAMGAAGGSSYADANVVAIEYDRRGRKVAMTDPDKGSWTYRYNALGELIEQTDARGLLSRLSYDSLGRVRTREAADHFARYFYDLGPEGLPCTDNRTNAAGAAPGTSTSVGLLCASTTQRDGASLAGVVQRSQTYEGQLRPLSESTLIYAGSGQLERRYVTALEYDHQAQRVRHKTYPTGLRVGYEYTALGFLNKVGEWATTGGGGAGAITVERWRAGSVNAWGQAETYTLGNGAIQRNLYDPYSGRLIQAGAGTGTADNVYHHTYRWDSLNNLALRTDSFGANGSEAQDEFQYDAINRLTRLKVDSPARPDLPRIVELSYNAAGNILKRSDVGVYYYPASGSERPHAVTAVSPAGGGGYVHYQYDVAGNMVSSSGDGYQSVTYNSFNQPDGVGGIYGRNGTRYTYVYDQAQQRLLERRVLADGSLRSTYKLHPDNAGGLGFEQEREGAAVTNRHYIAAAGGVVAMVQTSGEIYAAGQEVQGQPQASAAVVVRQEYWHKDHLGSIVALTEADGTVRARYAYDPWGQRRNPDGGLANLAPGDYPAGTDRGFTGHEHLDDVGIVHMNGRLFDPVLARFMQADPLVGNVFDLQNYNAYSYLSNRPLNSIDPDGRCELLCVTALALIGARATGIIDQQQFRMAMSIWVAAAIPVAWGGITLESAAIAGFASGVVGSGTLKGGAQGIFTSMVFYGVGQWANGLEQGYTGAAGVVDPEGIVHYDSNIWSNNGIGRAALHAAGGCVTSMAGSGNCASGAVTAGVGKYFTAQLDQKVSMEYGVARAAVVGGTLSVIGGGKFASGAQSGAFQYLFNQLSRMGDCAFNAKACTSADRANIRTWASSCNGADSCVLSLEEHARRAGLIGPSMGTVLSEFMDLATTPARLLTPLGWSVDLWKSGGEAVYGAYGNDYVGASHKLFTMSYGELMTHFTKPVGYFFSGRFGAISGFVVEKSTEPKKD